MKVEEFNGIDIYTTTYAYDALNRLTLTIDHLGNQTQVTYDSLGRKTEMTDPDMGHWSYVYDANNNLTTQIDAKNQIITFAYDALNRLTAKTYPDGSVIRYTYDDCPPATCGGLAGTNVSTGRLLKVEDRSGVHLFKYDALGRVIQDQKSLDDGNDYLFTRVYDSLGRVTSLEYPDGSVLALTFNLMGEAETMTLIRPDSTQVPIITNVDYNPSGQITKIDYGNGTTTDYTYNPQTLRLEHLLTLDPGSLPLQDLTYQFDNAGNILSLTDALNTNSQTFQYDSLNRLIQASGSYGTKTYQYNAIGNMTQKGDAALVYGDPSHPHAVTQLTDAAGTIDYVYDANGNRIQSGREAFLYDEDNRLTEVDDLGPAPPKQTLTFQPGWNTFTLSFQPFDTAAGAPLTQITDILAPLTLGADYDQVSYWDSALNQWRHFVPDPEFQEFTALTAGVTYQIYVTASQPVTVILEGEPPQSQPVTIASYQYDASGQRTKKVVSRGTQNAELTTIYYLGKDYEIEYNSGSSLTRKAFFLGRTRIAEEEIQDSGTPYLRFFHQDHLGSTNVVTSDAGAQMLLMEYLPFGEVKVREGSDPVSHTFTGHEEDTETSLIYANARYYDPKTGRFITADPTVKHPADPQDFNRYAYARNNPIRFIDPTGFGFFSFLKKLFGFGKRPFNFKNFISVALFMGARNPKEYFRIVVRDAVNIAIRAAAAAITLGGSEAAIGTAQVVDGGINVSRGDIRRPSQQDSNGFASFGLDFDVGQIVSDAIFGPTAQAGGGNGGSGNSKNTKRLQVFSRPVQDSIGRMVGARHEFIVDDQPSLFELEKDTNNKIRIIRLPSQSAEQYLRKWQRQLKGPLTVDVNKAKFEANFRRALLSRTNTTYNAGFRNSNDFVRSLIRDSGGGELNDESFGCVPGNALEFVERCLK